MKKIIKFFGVAVFMAALFVNVSISANKTAKNTRLIELISNANAICENGDWRFSGRCEAIYETCHNDYANDNGCDPTIN